VRDEPSTFCGQANRFPRHSGAVDRGDSRVWCPPAVGVRFGDGSAETDLPRPDPPRVLSAPSRRPPLPAASLQHLRDPPFCLLQGDFATGISLLANHLKQILLYPKAFIPDRDRRTGAEFVAAAVHFTSADLRAERTLNVQPARFFVAQADQGFAHADDEMMRTSGETNSQTTCASCMLKTPVKNATLPLRPP
jgi:hypothetical protein